MSKRGSKRRLRGTVEPPLLGELLSPPESAKKPRLITDTAGSDGRLEGGYCAASTTSNPSSSAVAVAASQLVGTGKAPCLWSSEEVVEFLQKSCLGESVVEAFKGIYVVARSYPDTILFLLGRESGDQLE